MLLASLAFCATVINGETPERRAGCMQLLQKLPPLWERLWDFRDQLFGDDPASKMVPLMPRGICSPIGMALKTLHGPLADCITALLTLHSRVG